MVEFGPSPPIHCDVMTEDERRSAFLKLFAIPRVGEQLWFGSDIMGAERNWTVTRIAHWVGNGAGDGYHRVAIYVAPTPYAVPTEDTDE